MDLFNKLSRTENIAWEASLVSHMFYDRDLTKKEIARRLNKSITWVTARLKYADKLRKQYK